MENQAMKSDLTVEKLEKELAEAEKKLEKTEKLIEAVKRDLEPIEDNYEMNSNYNDFKDEEQR